MAIEKIMRIYNARWTHSLHKVKVIKYIDFRRKLIDRSRRIITGTTGGQGSVESKLFAKEEAKVVVTDWQYDRLQVVV